MNCPNCGMVQQPEALLCTNCSTSLHAGSVQQVGVSALSHESTGQSHPAIGQEQSYFARLTHGLPHHIHHSSSEETSQALVTTAPDDPDATIIKTRRGLHHQTARKTSKETLAGQEQEPGKQTGQVPNEKDQLERKAEEENENERLMIFSDGVIAFALTIAAIPIKIPKDMSGLQVDTLFLHLATYILSFIFVYGLWKEHHTIFHHIKRNNGWLITLNSIFLALIVLIPIGLTLINIELEIENNNGYSILLFLGSLFGASLVLPLIWQLARKAKPHDLFGEQKPTRAFLIYTNWRLSALPFSMLFYIPAFVLLARGHSYLGLVIIAGFTIIRMLFFIFYRRRLQESESLTIGNKDTTRIQLFSDAIIGIAITITAAQIDPGNVDEAAKALSESWSLLGTYTFSFIIMGVYWLLHYHFFRFIKRYDPTLIMLNFVFLLLIILMFIPARLYTANQLSEPQYEVLFSLWQMATAGILYAMWSHAAYRSRKAHAPRLLKREVSTQQRKRLARLLHANPLIFLALGITGCFIPIPTIFYIAAYLLLLGGAWLVSHLTTRHMKEPAEQPQSEFDLLPV